MFLVKREESRYFDVFFGCFLCVLVFGREKKYVEKLGREKNSKKMCFFLVEGVPGAIYSLSMLFEATAFEGLPMALQGSPASKGL